MRYTVALTGGIGSGKSTVANAFARLGINIIDADIIARQVVEPENPRLRQSKNILVVKLLLKMGHWNGGFYENEYFLTRRRKHG